MLNGDGKEKGKKKSVGLISEKHQVIFSYISSPFLLQCETS